MRLRIVALAVVVLAAGTLATAGTITFSFGTPAGGINATPSPMFGTYINFDDQPTGSLLSTNQYLGLGVAISDKNNPLGYYSGTQSAPNYIGTGFGPGWAMDTVFSFTNPTNMIGLGIADAATTFQFFDVAGNLLATFSGVTNGANYYIVFSDTSWEIASMEVSSSYLAVDDLQFNQVPEPGSMILLGSGLFGLAGIVRRKLAR